jgi:hypothetical protein
MKIEARPIKRFLFKGYRLMLKSYPGITFEDSEKAFRRMIQFHIALMDFQNAPLEGK